MDSIIRVFLADASRDYLALLQAALEAEDDFLVVGTAVSGDRAAAQFPESGAALLLTDLLLPGLDGLSLLRRLQDAGCLHHAIVVSAFFNDRIARSVSGLADNFLPKPCPVAELIVHMRDAVRGGRAFVRDDDAAVCRALQDFGMRANLDGYAYLRFGLRRTLADRTLLRGVSKVLYREIASQYHTSVACVERSIRAAVRSAWSTLSDAERSRRFGPLFDGCSKAPTNVPFLSLMTEFLESRYETGR